MYKFIIRATSLPRFVIQLHINIKLCLKEYNIYAYVCMYAYSLHSVY